MYDPSDSLSYIRGRYPMGPLNKQVLKNLRAFRMARGWTQKELAQHIGIMQASYARLENGSKRTDFDTLEKIAAAFEIDICEFLKGAEGDPERSKELKELRQKESELHRKNERLTEQIRIKEQTISHLLGGE